MYVCYSKAYLLWLDLPALTFVAVVDSWILKSFINLGLCCSELQLTTYTYNNTNDFWEGICFPTKKLLTVYFRITNVSKVHKIFVGLISANCPCGLLSVVTRARMSKVPLWRTMELVGAGFLFLQTNRLVLLRIQGD